MRRATVAIVILAAAGLVFPRAGQSDPAELCEFENVVIFATNSVQLSTRSTTSGNVVANGQSPGPVLDEGAELAVDRAAIVHGRLSADSINLDRVSVINGDLAYNDLTDDGAIISGGQSSPLALPVFGSFPDFQVADVAPGAADVFVPAGGTVILGADVPRVTSYGNILIDKGGTLVFSGGGTFDVRSIGAASTAGGQCPYPCRSISFDAPTDLRVEGRFDSERDSFVGPYAAGVGAADIVIYVGGINGTGGGLFETPPAASIGRDSTVEANLYAANGTLQIDQATGATGAFLGRDVLIKREATVTLASAFVNQDPLAIPQGGVTNGDNAIVITLEGSDPEGGDLSFSIQGGSGPEFGTLGPITPIVPAPIPVIDRNGDPTGEFIQPPITQATVSYDPAGTGDLTDAFVFVVTDVCGASSSAAVDINPDDPDTEPCPVVPVSAGNVLADVAQNGSVGIELDGDGPDCADFLTFVITSLPSKGSLTDSGGGAIESVPTTLSDNFVTYNAGSMAGIDTFNYRVDHVSAGSDSALVTVEIDAPYELAPDSEVSLPVNTSVLVTLIGNPGGSGSSSFASSLGATSSGERPIRSRTFGVDRGGAVPAGNGTLTDHQKRLALAKAQGRSAAAAPDEDGYNRPAAAAPSAPQSLTQVGVGSGWVQFSWCDTTVSTACSGTLLDLQTETPSNEGPFEFTATGPVCLSITDTLAKGDHWRVENAGVTLGFTSTVPQSTTGTTSSPNVAFNDPTYSSASFNLAAGSYSIELIAIPPDSFYFGTAAFLRVDSGACLPNLTVTAFSAPDQVALDQEIGDQITATVTNTGNVPIPAGTLASIGFYTSTDSEITTADRLLKGGRENLSQQAPNGLTIGESVVIDLFDGASIASDFPEGPPLTGNIFIGVLVDEFNAVTESDETDNDASEPIEVDDGQPKLVWEILALPAQGTVTDPGTGALIGVGQIFTVQPTVRYTAATFEGTFSLQYKVTEGTIFDTAFVDFVVGPDNCLFNGRPAGCAPGSSLTSESAAAAGPAARQAPSDPLQGPTLTVDLVGPGEVTSYPQRWLGDRILGVQCGADRRMCSVKFAYGTDVKLMARPLEEATFMGWSGDCWGDEPIATLTIGSDSSCTAHFEEASR